TTEIYTLSLHDALPICESRTTSSSSTIRIRPLVFTDAVLSTAVAISFLPLPLPLVAAPLLACRRNRRRAQRQGHAKFRSLPRRRIHLDLAAVLLHDAVRHGQAQAGAVLILLGGEEGVENARQHILRDAASGVLHAQGRFAAGAIEFGDHLQAAARR